MCTCKYTSVFIYRERYAAPTHPFVFWAVVGHDEAFNLEIGAFRDLRIGAFRDFGFDIRISDPRPREMEGDKRETGGRHEGDRRHIG